MAAMFGLGRAQGWLLVLLTAGLGALVAAVAAWAGSALRAAITRRPAPSGDLKGALIFFRALPTMENRSDAGTHSQGGCHEFFRSREA